MGCKACQVVEKNEELLIKEIIKHIQTDSPSELSFFLKTYSKEVLKKKSKSIDDQIISLSEYKLSFLSYSVVTGSSKSFRVLTEKFNSSIKEMLNNFKQYQMDALNVICEKNHLDLLRIFLPLYLQCRQVSTININDTLDFHRTGLPEEPSDSFTPIQVACLYGSIAVINYLYNIHKESPIALTNIDRINEETGENCALLSVRSGSLQAVQLLHRKFNQDFFIRNIFGETALQICAICSTRRGGSGYLEIFIYLIEDVGLDPSINHEEILIVLQEKSIVEFYESQLEKFGIKVKKRELDRDVEINQRINVVTPIGKQSAKMESVEKCSLGSTISVNSNYTDFFGGSIGGNKLWFTN